MTCDVTTTVQPLLAALGPTLFRCDREPKHTGLHHGIRPDRSELYWPGTHESGASHEYDLTCRVCGQLGTIRLTIDPQTAP
jgi:hypothetical protein